MNVGTLVLTVNTLTLFDFQYISYWYPFIFLQDHIQILQLWFLLSLLWSATVSQSFLIFCDFDTFGVYWSSICFSFKWSFYHPLHHTMSPCADLHQFLPSVCWNKCIREGVARCGAPPKECKVEYSNSFRKEEQTKVYDTYDNWVKKTRTFKNIKSSRG